jgi:hypothetical protein
MSDSELVEVTPRTSAAVAFAQPASDSQALMRVIETAALRQDFDVQKLQALLAVKREFEADEARKAFVAAKADFKAEDIVIGKDKANTQYDSRYTSLGNLVNTVRPFLSKHGLTADWDQTQTDGLVVTCRLSHKLGHSESSSFKVPPDTSGAKNPIQQIKSAITYARAVTFEAVCGLAATDANNDDDGNGAHDGAAELRRLSWLRERKAEIATAKNIGELKKVMAAAVAKTRELGDQDAEDQLEAAFAEKIAKVQPVKGTA